MRYNLENYIAEAKEQGIFVRFPDTNDAESYGLQFEQLISWDTRCNHTTLIVYEHNHKPIAFYDVTTLEGFILKDRAIELEN